ncbi:MAG: hypothetical protein ABJN36_02285 [Cyclobacteriaceae bacterium]
MVSNQSKGGYELDFSQIDIVAIDKEIRITDLILTKSKDARTDTAKQVYKVIVPRAEISLGSLTAIYFGKELTINGIKIHDPEIIISKSGNQTTKTTFSLETGSLYNAISEYLKAFSIGSLDIQNASVNYQQSPQKNPFQILVDQIDFSIDNFLLDSIASEEDKFLFTDKIELIISNQKFELPDSVHALSFDEFHISTGTGDILFKNLEIKPSGNEPVHTLDSYMNIEVPELNFRGLDFNKAYSENKLQLDSIRVLNPRILVKKKKSKQATKEPIDLLSLSTKVFESFEIGKVYFDAGKIEFITDQNKFSSTALNLKLSMLSLDSTKAVTKDWMSLFDDVALDAKDFHTFIMDSTHKLDVSHFNYSSFTSHLELEYTKIHPIVPIDDAIVVNVDLKRANAEGLATLSDLISGRLVSSEITIVQPNISVDIPTSLKRDSSKNSEFLKYLRLGKFDLVDGTFIANTEDSYVDVEKLDINFGKVSFQPSDLENFVFNSFTSKSHIDLQLLEFNSKKLKLNLHQVNLNNWKDLVVTDVFLKPETAPEPFTFGEIRITEFDLDHFLHNQLLAFDTLIVDRPIIPIHPHHENNNNRDNLVKWAHHTAFKEMHFRNGNLTQYGQGDSTVQLHLENFDVELSKFHYDSLRDEYYTLVGYKSDSIYLHLSKMEHQITGRDLDISIKDSTLSVKQLHMKPTSDKANNKINVATHELHLRQIDFHTLINDQKIHFKDGYLLSPVADIKTYKESKEVTNLRKDLLKFHLLNISNGKIHFENHISDSSMVADADKINIMINEFDLGKDSTIFSARNYLGEVQHMVFRPFGQIDSLTIQKAFVNTKAGHIKISDLKMAPSDAIRMHFPTIEIKGFDPEKMAHKKQVTLDSIIITQPYINVNLNKPKSAKNKNRQPLPYLAFNNLNIRDGNTDIVHADINFGETVAISDINLSIDSVQIDSTTTISKLVNKLQSTKLKMSNIAVTTPDSLYQFSVASINYDGVLNEINLNDIVLDPIYSRDEFSRHHEFQKDWFDMELAEIKISGFQALKWIEEERVHLNTITITRLLLDTHKDKRLPLPPDSEKPLPQALLSSIPIPIFIDQIKLISSYVSHSEYSPTGTLPGVIFFQDLNAEINNITNDSLKLSMDPIMTFHSTGTMMNTGHFTVDVDFDLEDENQFYYFRGELVDMNLTELNELLENTAFVHIKDGYNKRVTFNFEANHDYALGEMKFYYNDLKIMVLNQKAETHKHHAASIKSFFANTFVVNKKNPHLLFVRQGDIFHHRNVNKAIFNYWAKALLSGVVSSIGAKNNKKEIKKLNEELKAQLDRKRDETLRRLGNQTNAN